MDKNYINIDDLVRQRLGGAEESESHSAWMRMSELLDEPKRKKPGFFFWRNTLGAVSALVLLGLAGMGSYKVSSYSSNKSTESQQLVASAMNGRVNAKATTTAIRKEVVAANATSGTHARHTSKTIAFNNTPSRSTEAHEDAHMAVNNEPEFNSTNGTKTVFLKNENAVNNDNTTNTTTTKNNNNATAGNNTGNKHQATAHKAASTKHNTSVTASVNKPEATAENPSAIAVGAPEASSSKTLASSNAQPVTGTTQKHVDAGKPGAQAVASTKEVTPGNEVATGNKMIVAAHAPAAKGNVSKSHAAGHKSHAVKTEAKETAAANSEENTSITAKVIAEAIAASKHNAEKAEHSAKASTANKVIGENATAANTNVAKTAGSTANHKAANGSKATAKKATAQSVKDMPLASAGTPAKETAKAGKTTAAEPVEPTVAATRERKVVNKLLLRETYIKTAPNDGYFKLDTISMEMLVKEQPETNENNTGIAAAAAKKSSKATGSNETNAGAETPADPNVLAAVKEESASQKAAEVKEKPVVKNTVSAAEKLSMAFNDMKNNIRGMQFAPGLTGGINGTFFGPSGYKGFQFGVTGELIYNDNLSLKGELKYFNRLNGNDYSLQDDYYTYTASGGQYVKTQQIHSVSFASVQSLELPISVRYSSGKFCFFAGGNAAYSFAVNAAESTLASPTSTTVASKGTDNAPTIRESDFGSRFGVGYLFGMSYVIAPNFTLDLRNVQTVWDNASSTGAKTVSSQMYKHPSFQLSIGYRFGAKKSED